VDEGGLLVAAGRTTVQYVNAAPHGFVPEVTYTYNFASCMRIMLVCIGHLDRENIF
jgi:hypothetical protein